MTNESEDIEENAQDIILFVPEGNFYKIPPEKLKEFEMSKKDIEEFFKEQEKIISKMYKTPAAIPSCGAERIVRVPAAIPSCGAERIIRVPAAIPSCGAERIIRVPAAIPSCGAERIIRVPAAIPSCGAPRILQNPRILRSWKKE